MDFINNTELSRRSVCDTVIAFCSSFLLSGLALTMNRGTFQIFTRQVLAIPVDGGIVIAEKLQSRTIYAEEVTVTTI